MLVILGHQPKPLRVTADVQWSRSATSPRNSVALARTLWPTTDGKAGTLAEVFLAQSAWVDNDQHVEHSPLPNAQVPAPKVNQLVGCRRPPNITNVVQIIAPDGDDGGMVGG